MGIFSFLSSLAKEELKETPRIEMNADLKKALEKAIPSSQGLFPHEIILISYAPSYNTEQRNFQQFWKYDYYIDNPMLVLNSLYQRGFIDIGSLKDTLEYCKISELKEELKSIGEKVSGRKDELIGRLIDKGNINLLENKYPEKHFTVTDKGEKELLDNEYVLYLHKRHQIEISPWEMNILIGGNKQSILEYKEILLQILEKEAQKNLRKCNFGLYRNTKFSIAEMLKEEKKYKEAFRYLCEVVAYDLSGLENNEDVKQQMGKVYMIEQALRSHFPYHESMLTIPQGIMQELEAMQELLGVADIEYEKLLHANLEKSKLPYSIFNAAECVEIVMCEKAKKTDRLCAIYESAEMRLKKELNQIKI